MPVYAGKYTKGPMKWHEHDDSRGLSTGSGRSLAVALARLARSSTGGIVGAARVVAEAAVAAADR